MNITATVPEKMLQIQGVTRLVQATNDDDNLRMYLSFAQPVLNSSEQILSALTVTDAVLTPTNRSTLGNRRFGYVVSSSSSYNCWLLYFSTSATYVYLLCSLIRWLVHVLGLFDSLIVSCFSDMLLCMILLTN